MGEGAVEVDGGDVAAGAARGEAGSAAEDGAVLAEVPFAEIANEVVLAPGPFDES